jgi:hypothetical protein
MPQDTRNYVARLLLRLTLQELFEFRFMQVRGRLHRRLMETEPLISVVCRVPADGPELGQFLV